MSTTHPRRRLLAMHDLESRTTPATLVNASTLTYTDIDGDIVKVVFTTPVLAVPILTPSNVDSIFTFDAGNVNGNNNNRQLLKSIQLPVGLTPEGMGITTTATRTSNAGDGFATIGQIDASNIDLGTVRIDGDLGRILAGNPDPESSPTGLAGLAVHSLGRYDISTGANDLESAIQGRLGSLSVKADITGAFIDVLSSTGSVGNVSIGGSLIGRSQDDSGKIQAAEGIGNITIGGSIYGGTGHFSGQILTNRSIGMITINGSVVGGLGTDSARIRAFGSLAGLTIKGSLIGSSSATTGGSGSGEIFSAGSIGHVRIGGSMIGGTGQSSARINATQSIGNVTVGGSLVGRAGGSAQIVAYNGSIGNITVGGSLIGGDFSSALISASTTLGTVTINGDLRGGDFASGTVRAWNGNAKAITIKGSVLGGFGDHSGKIQVAGVIPSLTIGGDLVGGNAFDANNLSWSGSVLAKQLTKTIINGSAIAGWDNTTGTYFHNGAIVADQNIGTLQIKGNVFGNNTNPFLIQAARGFVPGAVAALDILSISVGQNLEWALIRAGYDAADTPVNADAQIGSLTVGGDWIASNVIAGVIPTNGFFGDGDDATIPNGVSVNDSPDVTSKIGKVIIKGQLLGSHDTGNVDSFGIVAQHVVSVVFAGVPMPLLFGSSNDNLALGITGDFNILEVPPS